MGPPEIIVLACPHCPQQFEHVIRSWNTFGACYYSDGKCEGPMVFDEVDIIRCPQCKNYLWIDELDEQEQVHFDEDSFMDFDPDRYLAQLIYQKEKAHRKEKHPPKSPKYLPKVKTKRLSQTQRFAALKAGAATDGDKERALRFAIWWEFNDRIRHRALAEQRESLLWHNKKEERLWEENLHAIQELVDPVTEDDRILRAEVYRELGNFELARQTLDHRFKKAEYESAVSLIKVQCEMKNPFVCQFAKSE